MRNVVVLVLVLVLTVGCSSSTGGGSGGSVNPGSGAAIDWSNGTITLTAASAVLTYDDLTFVDASMPTEVEIGSNTDVTWAEAGYTPRIHFDYHQDASSWTIAALRVHQIGETGWIYDRGPLYTTPLGQAYDGDMMFSIDENGHYATLTLTGANLAPFGVQ